MKSSSIAGLLLIAGMALVPGIRASADLKIVTTVSVTNPPSNSGSVAQPGTYATVYHKSQARTNMPDGTYRVFDLDKKQVWVVDPKQKTFFQLPLDAYLKLGSNLPAGFGKRYQPNTSSTFKQADGQSPRQVMGLATQPFDAVALGSVDQKAPSGRGGGGRGGGRRGGGGGLGGIFGGGGGSGSATTTSDPGVGATATDTNAVDYSTKTFGQFWMAKPPTNEISAGDLAIPQICLALANTPGLHQLIDSVRKSNLLPVESDFTIERGLANQPTPKPVITSTIVSIESTSTTPDDFLIPSDYRKIDAPASTWSS